MRKVKNIVIVTVAILCVLAIVIGIILSKNWTIRFHSELNRFFGEGNWECIDQETKESMIYDDYIIVHSNPAMSGDVPGKFQNWYIQFKNRNGEDEIWHITNHTLKINHDEYGIFSPKRYSQKQAFVLELMDISFGLAGDEIWKDFIQSRLSEQAADCFEVAVSYTGGNPEPEFYDDLWEQPWFTANTVTAGDYLSCDLHDFYLEIRAHDYRLEKLNEEEYQQTVEALPDIEADLLEEFGDSASFTIYFDGELWAEYVDGVKTGR